MEKQYSVQFFTSFVENLQRLCQNYINYDQMVEVSGYISVEIDNAKKERYVLSELVQSTGNVISESYCTKVFKNCPLPLQRSPAQGRREPPVMSSQISPAGKRPLTQTSPSMNRMGRSPQMTRQMSPSGVLRPNNDNNQRSSSFNQRPSSFSQRLNQAPSFGPGRGAPPRMSSNFPGSGPGRGTMPPNQRFGQQGGNPVGRPGMPGNPRMMNPSQRMNQQGGPQRPGQMPRSNSDPNQRMGPGPTSIQARKSFGPGQRGQAGQPQSKSPVDDPDELEVISFVPPPRRSVGEASTSSLSSGTRSPLTPETSSSSSNRPQFPTGNRSGSNTSSIQQSSQAQSNTQSIAMPVSLVQNVAQSTPPQMSRNQSQQMTQQTSQHQDFNRPSMQHSSQASSHTMPQVSQASDGRHGFQNQNMSQSSQPSESVSQAPHPTRQQIVQQMLQARANANRNLQIPPSLQQHPSPPVSQQGPPAMQQQGPHPMSSQQMSQSMPPKPPAMPQQMYPNQSFSQNQLSLQPPHTPPGQIMSSALQDPTRNIWDEMTQPGNFPQAVDKKDPGILGSLNLPSLDSSVDSTGPLEISARNTSFMDTVEAKKELAVSSSAPTATVASSSHLSFPDDPLGSLQISNVVSLPQDTLPDIPSDTVNTSQAPTSFGDMNSSTTPSMIAEAFASLDSVTLQDAAASMDTEISEVNSSMAMDNNLEDDLPIKKARLSTDTNDQTGAPTSTNPKLMVPIGRKIKEFAAKKRAKRGRPRLDKSSPQVKLGNGESEDEDTSEFGVDLSVDPPNRTLRSQGRNPLRRIYNESSDSESSLPEFGLNFESTVSTSAGLVLAGEEGGPSEDGEKDSGGGGSDTAPAPPELYSGSEKKALSTGTADSRKSPDVLTEAENESYVIIELESDDEFDELGPGGADSSTPVVKQELSTFTKPVQFAINRLTQFMILKKVKEPAYSIIPETLDPLLAEFYLRLRKSDGEEFIASSLKQIQNCIGTYLSTNGYPFDIKSDPKFDKSRKTMENKLKHLRSREDAIFTMRPEDVDKLYEIGKLGTGSVESLLNTMWLMNTIHFSIRRPRDHINLKWGDVKLSKENHQDYIEHLPSGKIVWKNVDNPKRCFVTLYKKYRQLRPASAQGTGSSFYLAYSEKTDSLKHQKYGDQAMANIFRRMLSAAGLPPAMKISNLDIL